MELILIDTSVWIDHIRSGDGDLTRLLRARRCLVHPFVLAEIALGRLSDWRQRINGLRALPRVEPMSEDELLTAIERLDLPGCGLGFVDTHLLATAQSGGHKLWSRDKRLNQQAHALELDWTPPN